MLSTRCVAIGKISHGNRCVDIGDKAELQRISNICNHVPLLDGLWEGRHHSAEQEEAAEERDECVEESRHGGTLTDRWGLVRKTTSIYTCLFLFIDHGTTSMTDQMHMKIAQFFSYTQRLSPRRENDNAAYGLIHLQTSSVSKSGELRSSVQFLKRLIPYNCSESCSASFASAF